MEPVIYLKDGNTITVEDAVTSFDKAGIKPIACNFTKIDEDGIKYGCLITALACSIGKITFEDFVNISSFKPFIEVLNLPEDFSATALYDGFDQNGFNTNKDEYKFGKAVREELKKRGMMK